MKKACFVFLASLVLLTGCGSSTHSQKYSELSSQYDYYSKSASLIEKNMKISADEADEVFLVMVDCGVSSEINYVTNNNDGTWAVWSAGDKYTVTIENGAVATVFSGKDQLYPENVRHNDLLDFAPTVRDVMNGTGDTVIGQYAYITLTDEQLEEITAEHLKEFADTVVDGSGYNWFSIKSYSGNGICFSGSDISSAVYGKLDKDCSVLETLGFWVRDADGNYTYSENK